jgi:transcriptional regulator with XRE-family HTH domain
MGEFAEKARISRSALYHFIEDKRRPTENMIARICKTLGVPVEEGKAQYTPSSMGRPTGSKNKPKTGDGQ